MIWSRLYRRLYFQGWTTNSLYLGLPLVLLNRQLLQNATSIGFWLGPRSRSMLVWLHWLPVNFRMEFNVVMFVCKALHGQIFFGSSPVLPDNKATGVIWNITFEGPKISPKVPNSNPVSGITYLWILDAVTLGRFKTRLRAYLLDQAIWLS